MRKIFFFLASSGSNQYYVSNNSYLSKNYKSKVEVESSPALNWYEAKYYDHSGAHEVLDLNKFFESRDYFYVPLKTFKKGASDDEYIAFKDKMYDTSSDVSVTNIEKEHTYAHDPSIYYLKGKPYPVLTSPDTWPEPAELRKFLLETTKRFRVQAADVMRKVFSASPNATSLQKAIFCKKLSNSIPCVAFLLVKGLGINPEGLKTQHIFKDYLGLDEEMDENKQHALDADMLLGFPPGTLIPESYV